jgi:chromatin segregation and condensation protein Rec8/ScpA/Scc1 (kleisin family)
MLALAQEPPQLSLAHMGLRFPPIERFLERFRAVLRHRSAFMLDAELDGLKRLEQAAAFLALLELRKSNEVRLEQSAPFAPIRVSRPDVERSSEWRTARSA